MTEQEAIDKIKSKCHTGDQESDHMHADDVLREFLMALGYKELVAAYDEIDKWFA